MIRRLRIAGTGSYAPERVLSNLDLEKMVDTTDAWIVERTGIRERRIATQEEAVSDMALHAARSALSMAGVKPAELDMIIFATVSEDMPLPASACFLQRALGAPGCPAFDIAAACAGFVFGLSIAQQYVQSGTARKILLVGAELLSKYVNWEDRNTCVLFGDGAGAAVLTPSDDDTGLLGTAIHSDGTLTDILSIPGGGTRHPATHETIEKKLHKIHMNGREVFKAAVRNLVDVSNEILRACGVSAEQVSLVIPHQANLRILEAMAERCGIPLSKFYLNIEKYGNTSSASIPIALDEANRAGLIKQRDIILMGALGGGVSWGAALMRW